VAVKKKGYFDLTMEWRVKRGGELERIQIKAEETKC
jgi:hypothetical protein